MSRLLRLGRLALLVAALGPHSLPSAPLHAAAPARISRTPPPAYAERAAALLTPFEAVRAIPAAPASDDAQVLVDERVHLVQPDGRVLRVRQVAYRVLAEPGVKPMAEDLFSYSRDRQKFHLVRAAVIQPDGSEQLVAPDAIIVQSPQRSADLAVYDDTNEVRVIYPHVRVGSVTHAIVVIEDTAVRFPDAYTTRQIWGGYWPTGIERFCVELPPGLASRVRWFDLGPGVPKPVTLALPDASVRLEWRAENQPGRRYEKSRAPASQTGPVLRLSSIAGWDDVAAWFHGLVAGRDSLPPGLAAEAARWTEGSPDRDTTIRRLFQRVADDVRYVSLALGDGDYQPRDCGEVWSRRHGDCKDKSNLLVALLRHAGIPAHLALLNTDHLGLIDRRAPDYHAFTHAIVAIPDERGGYVFCDPTIACGAPGLLSPSSADRDVLVVRDGRAEWSRTPPADAGRLDHAFDLALNSAGELSGWLTVTAEGLHAAWERDRDLDLDLDARRDSFARTVRGFFPGADIVDVTVPSPSDAGAPAVSRAYFIVPASGDAATGPAALRFPVSRGLLLDLGSTEKRETALFLYPEKLRATARLALPPGLAPASLPAPFTVDTPTGLARASWASEPGAVQTEFEIDLRRSALPPSEFPRFYQAMLALENWLGQAVPLAAAGTESATPPASPHSVDLPLMPTGRGQLALIERRYPASGDRSLRRAALLRALQYFPNDAATAFEAGVYIADLDWQAGQGQAALDRVDALLATHRGAVAADDFAWGEHLRALVLRDLGRVPEAVVVFTRLVRDPSGDPWRRSQCALAALPLLESADPAQAEELLALCAPLPSEKQGLVLAALSRRLLARGDDDALRARLEFIAAARPADLDGLLATITDQSESWPGDPQTLRARWVELARSLAPVPGENLAVALDRADAEARLLASAQDIRRRIQDALSRPPLRDWFAAEAPPAASFAAWTDFIKARETLVERNASDACVRLGVRAMLDIPPSASTLDRLWRVASDADWHERRADAPLDYPILPFLLDLCDLVPATHDTLQEGRFLRGAYLARRGQHATVRDLFAGLLADPGFPSAYRLTAHVRLADAHEALGELPEAVAAARPLEDHVADSARNADRVFRSALIQLHLGRPAEALRLIEVLEKATEDTLKKADCELLLRELIALRRSGHAESFWAAHREWWPLWEKVAGALGLPPPGPETFSPVIVDLAGQGQKLRQALEAKDHAAYWREFRRVVSAARWAPSIAPEISGLQSQAVEVAPDQAPAFLDLVLAALAVPGSPESNARLRGFHVAATLYDAGRHADALAAVAAHRRAHPVDDPQTRSVNRVWALAALASGKELQEASAALEYDLAHPVEGFPRGLTVEALANLHRARHLTEEEAFLLERELGHPQVLANEAVHRRLKERHEHLGGSLRFATAVRRWLEARAFPWYDHATPASLDDPRLRDLGSALEKPERQFTPFETIKLRLLAAQNPEIGLAAQTQAFRLAAENIHSSLPRHSEALAFAESVVENADLDASLRAHFLWHLLLDAYDRRRPAEYARWRDHPLGARRNTLQKEIVADLDRAHAVDLDDLQALDALADELRGREVDNIKVALLHEIFGHYVRLGALDRAAALVASASSWRLADDVTASRESNAIQLARALRAAEAQDPVHRALLALVRARFPVAPADVPAEVADTRAPVGELVEFSPADTRAAGLRLVLAQGLTRQSLGPWAPLIAAFHHHADTRELSMEMIEAAILAAPDDDTRAEVLAAFFYQCDLDQPAILARIRAATASYEDPVAHPLSSRYLRAQRVALALRYGEPVDFESSLLALDGPGEAYQRHVLTLRRHLQQDDAAALKRVLRALDPSLLLNSGMLQFTLPALERAGMKTELGLARETARRELRDAVVGSWIDAEPRRVRHAESLAEALGEPDPFPGRWIESISARCPDPMRRFRVRLIDAWLRSDWQSSARHAQELIRAYPTHYDNYWYAGAALHRLGRRDEARPLLRTYVARSKNDVQYLKALALLGEGPE